jgi:hypothetical protein
MPSHSIRASAFVLLGLSPLLAQAPPDVVQKVAAAEKDSRVMEHLDHLTNRIGPRLTGSERLTTACEWARDQFKAFGIENARLEEWGTFEVGFDRGRHRGTLKTAGGTREVTFGTDAWTPGTEGLREGSVVVAPVDEAGLGDFRKRVKGAWVVRPKKCRVWKSVTEICAEAGALGTIENASVGAAFAGKLAPKLILTGGNHHTKWDKLPKLVRVNLLASDFEDILDRTEKGEAVTLALDVQNRFKQGPIKLYNVLADIPGTEKPDEIVIVGGHIDSWDGATGTTDNGTGVATTLEAARLLMAAGAKPRRTIRFMLWSGEEQGLLGSKAWIKNHPDELDRISAVLVHDGGTNYVAGINTTAAMLPAMKTAFKPVIELLGQTMEDSVVQNRGRESRPSEDENPVLKFTINQATHLPYPIGSDHDSFLARGVPGFFWRQSGRANYTYTHHTQHDTYDAAIPEYQRHSSKVIALGALGIANLDEKLPRSKDMIRQGGFMPRRRLLGVQFESDENLTIEGFTDESRAEKAGMKTGDKVIKIDGVAVSDRNQASELLAGGLKKKITFLRDKKEQEVTIEFPAPESRP